MAVFLGRVAPIWSQTASSPPVQANPAVPAQQAASQPIPRPMVMIDPAHGGAESGAILNPVILEKDVTLSLARRLRLDLTARGVVAQLSREGDVTLSTDDRAAKTNAERAALYVCLHASSGPTGITIFSAMLPESADDRGPFIGWEGAQTASLPASRAAQAKLASSLQKTGFSVRSFTAPLAPLNNLLVPAVAVEIAPTAADVSQLISPDYQQTVSTAVANAIASILATQGNAPGSIK